MCVHQGLEALGSLPSTLGWQVGARWALDRDEGSYPASVLASSAPIAHAQKPFHGQAVWERWLPLSPTPPSCRAPTQIPLSGLCSRPRLGSGPAWSTMWLLVPQPG